jgi:hypothetical protein
MRVVARAPGVAILLGACIEAPPSTPGDTDETDPVADGTPTYHHDVRPILEKHCTACHQPGGIGTMSLVWDPATAATLQAWFGPVAQEVAAGRMPPWPPDEACHPTEHPRVLSDAEKARIAAWADADYPLGDEATYRPPRLPAVDPTPPDVALTPAEAYTPSREGTDDYRCFVLDHDFDEQVWMRGFDVVPGSLQVVHHVLMFRVDGAHADQLAAWDAAEEGPGYTCFGSPYPEGASLPGLPETVAGWAPGQAPERYEDGTARRIQAGSKLVLQVHYNTQTLAPTAPTPEDRTEVDLWLLPEGEAPFWEIASVPLPNTDLAVTAGDAHSVQTLEMPLDFLPQSVRIRGAFPHMHNLGTSIRADAIREDGSELCIVDVPRWDFHWQQSYLFAPDDTIQVANRAKIRLTCTYDNSAANQPYVDGVQQPPQDVHWGERTQDEMCLVYLYGMVPADVH